MDSQQGHDTVHPHIESHRQANRTAGSLTQECRGHRKEKLSMGSTTQESRGLGQTDIVTVFVTCQALAQSSQNSEVGTVLAILSTGNKRTQVQQHAQDPRPRS